MKNTKHSKLIDDIYLITTNLNKTCQSLNCNYHEIDNTSKYVLDITTYKQKSLFDSLNKLKNAKDIIETLSCPTCKRRTFGYNYTTIKNVNTILTIKLDNNIKNIKCYDFPFLLDMKDYIQYNSDNNNTMNENITNNNNINNNISKNKNTKYQLIGVIIHQGSELRGHYFAYYKDTKQKTKWTPKKNKSDKIKKIIKSISKKQNMPLNDFIKQLKEEKLDIGGTDKANINSFVTNYSNNNLYFNEKNKLINKSNKIINYYPNHWYLFDDTTVTPVTDEDIRQIRKKKQKPSKYNKLCQIKY